MRILCCQQFLCRLQLRQCIARELIVGCLQLFTRSCRLAACQNPANQPIACIWICLLYLTVGILSLFPCLLPVESKSCQETAGKKMLFHRHHAAPQTLSEALPPGKSIGLEAAKIFMSIFWVFVPLMHHLLFSDEGYSYKLIELQVGNIYL